jgi:hypothetical protein
MRVHPLLRLVATEPQVLTEHAAAYAALIHEEASRVSAQWLRKSGLYLVAGVLGMIAAILGGVAALLYVGLPGVAANGGWQFWAIPALPLVVALVFVGVARALPVEEAFATVKEQMDADRAMLREALGS